MLTEEKINSNYLLWMQKLEKYNCYSQSLIDEMGTRIKDASFGMNVECGAAYQGAMIDVTLNYLCNFAYKFNETFLHTNIGVSMEKLMKVLLLQHISKAELFNYNSNPYGIKNGKLYEFNNELETKLKCGERSVFLCMKHGIILSEDEYEAMLVIDKVEDNGDMFMNPLAFVVKTINKLVISELRQKYLRTEKCK